VFKCNGSSSAKPKCSDEEVRTPRLGHITAADRDDEALGRFQIKSWHEPVWFDAWGKAGSDHLRRWPGRSETGSVGQVKTEPVASNELRALCWRPRNEVGMAMWAGHAGLVFLFALCSSLFSGGAPAFNTNLYFVLHQMIPPVMPYRCGDCGFRTGFARGIAGDCTQFRSCCDPRTTGLRIYSDAVACDRDECTGASAEKAAHEPLTSGPPAHTGRKAAGDKIRRPPNAPGPVV
jgi:hypothetical protein